MKWYFTSKLIILQYRQFSCGKFLSNILSYNKNFIPQYRLSGKHDLSNEVFYDIENKHNTIIDTLPPIDKLNNWLDYELGCQKFFGFNILRGTTALTMTELKRSDQMYNKTKDLLLDDKVHSFAMAHTDPHFNAWKGVFPLSKHIQLINDSDINIISRKMKSDKPPLEVGKFSIRADSHKFDIGTLFDKQRFFSEVSKLLTSLELDDISLDDRVNIYYDRYVSLYEPYLRA